MSSHCLGSAGDEHARREPKDSKSHYEYTTPDTSSSGEVYNRYFLNWRVLGSLLSFCIGYNTAYWSFAMPSNVLSLIVADLEPSTASSAIWIITSTTLGQAIAIPIIGRLSDIFGRRWYFIASNALVFVGTIIASRATTVPMLIAANTLTGLGSAAQLAGSVISGELVPNQHRYLLLCIISCCFAPIMALAPAIGRLLTTQTSQGWRSIYYLNAGVTFVVVVLQFLCYYPQKHIDLTNNEPKTALFKRFDFAGLFIFAGSSAAFLVSISWAGPVYGWSSADFLASLLIGILGWGGFILWQRVQKRSIPLIPLAIWNRDYSCITIASCVSVMTFYSLNLLWPQQLAMQYEQSITHAGWVSCSVNGGLVLGQLVGGLLVKAVRNIKWQLVASCTLLTLFMGTMAIYDVSLPAGITLSLFAGAATGYVEIITMVGGPMMVDPEFMGIAVGAQSTLRALMNSVALTIFTAILDYRLDTERFKFVSQAAIESGISSESIPAVVNAMVLGDLSLLFDLVGMNQNTMDAITRAGQIAATKSFQAVYLVSLAFGTTATLASLFVTKKGMDSMLTVHVARRIKGVPSSKTEAAYPGTI